MLQLFLPLKHSDFLVPDERILYERPYHPAILLQPAFEFAAVIFLALFLQLDISVTHAMSTFALVVASIFVIGRLVFELHWSSQRMIGTAVAVFLLAVALQLNFDQVIAFAVLGFAIRFGLRWLRWRFYRRILVTDRRVIEIDGLIGSQVATMPLFRITDALLARNAAAELLGYALFRIESAGQNQALGRINFLDDADNFHSLLIQLSTTAKTDPLLVDDDDMRSQADRLL